MHEALQTTPVFCLENKMLKMSNRNKNFDYVITFRRKSKN